LALFSPQPLPLVYFKTTPYIFTPNLTAHHFRGRCFHHNLCLFICFKTTPYIFTLIFISVSIFVLGLLSAFGQQKQTQQKEERENFTKSI
jgi:hypothetical protein